MASIMEDTELTALKKELLKSAMTGEWSEVVALYRKDPRAHVAKITRFGDTALHIAVNDGQEDIVEELVEHINKAGKNVAILGGQEPFITPGHGAAEDIGISGVEQKYSVDQKVEALYIKNEDGDTPLHLAAAVGSVRMCRCIAEVDPTLAGCRNRDNQNPIFTAVLHGEKEVFLHLYNICDKSERSFGSSRGNNGNTILHTAIGGEYFDLAFQIIRRYQDLVNCVNERGLSPLHQLASKPSAFRSGSHLNRLQTIIYHCTFVEYLKVTDLSTSPSESQESKGTADDFFPTNYKTCVISVKLIWDACSIAIGIIWNKIIKKDSGRENAQQSNTLVDAENPTETKGPSLMQDSGRGNAPRSSTLVDIENPQDYAGPFPPNYFVLFEFVKLIFKALFIVLGLGSREILKVRKKKEKHTWSLQVLDELLERASTYGYEDDGTRPLLPSAASSKSDGETNPYENPESTTNTISTPKTTQQDGSDEKKGIREMETREKDGMVSGKCCIEGPVVDKIHELLPNKNVILLLAEGKKEQEINRKETPVLIAAKNGITEMVEKILELFPVAIHDMDSEKKNMIHLAVEHRHPHVYELLHKRKRIKETLFRGLDNEGNSALHLSAMLREYKPWNIPGEALQMQWELKWFKYVKYSMPLHFFVHHNKVGKTAGDIFRESHKDLMQKGGEWLTNTSNSCSVVAALIATVAFATAATVPGGVRQENGEPTLEHHAAFNIFAITSLVALCFSVTALVMFLAILTSRHQEKDFGGGLPRRLLVGLTSLFVSIAAMLVSFCAGHFFVLRDELKYVAIPVYAVTCLPVTFFAVAQFPLYVDLLWAMCKRLPQRTYKSIL